MDGFLSDQYAAYTYGYSLQNLILAAACLHLYRTGIHCRGNGLCIVPIWEKQNLTLEEAAAYSGIGVNRLYEMTKDGSCPFVLWVGSKRLIKRKRFDQYIEQSFSI